MSETKAAFAERAIQSLKHIIFRYIEGHGEKFIPKLQQFVSTLNCRKNRSIGKSPRDMKNSDFLLILYNNSFKKYTKPKIKIGERVRILKNDIPLIHHQRSRKEEILGNFYEKELRKCSD